MKPPTKLLSAAAVVLYLFLYAPIAVVMIFSFNATRHGVGWHGFTTEWYRVLFANRAALEATGNTLLLACTSAAVATVLGTMLGYALHRYAVPGRVLISRLLHVPVFIPDVVMAAALLLFFSLARQWLGVFELGMGAMFLAHVTFEIPFVTLVVRSRMAGLDTTLEEAAHDLGANAWQTFRHVTLPLMLPGVLAGALLAFTLSLDDFVVSFFTSGPGSTTLSILIYSSVKRGVTPDIHALSTLLVLASIAGTMVVTLLQSRGRKSL